MVVEVVLVTGCSSAVLIIVIIEYSGKRVETAQASQ